MSLHRPVMPVEALNALDAGKGGLFVDATLGLGGHTELILQASPLNRVIGFDRDAEAIALAKERLTKSAAVSVCVRSIRISSGESDSPNLKLNPRSGVSN